MNSDRGYDPTFAKYFVEPNNNNNKSMENSENPKREMRELIDKLEETRKKVTSDKMHLNHSYKLNDSQNDSFVDKFQNNPGLDKVKQDEIKKARLEKLDKIRQNKGNNTNQGAAEYHTGSFSGSNNNNNNNENNTNNYHMPAKFKTLDINALAPENTSISRDTSKIGGNAEVTFQPPQSNRLTTEEGDRGTFNKSQYKSTPDLVVQARLKERPTYQGLEEEDEQDYNNNKNKSFDLPKEVLGSNANNNKSLNKSMLSEGTRSARALNLTATTPRGDDNYIQFKFYQRMHEKQQAWELLENQIVDDIKKKSNSKKMSENSYKLMIKKLESTLTLILMDIDKDKTRKLSFEQLGRLLTLLGVFRVIQYDENNKLENEEQFFSNQAKDQKLRYREMIMHEQVWNILTHKMDTDTIDAEFVYILFRILLDPAQLPIEEISKILEDYIRKYRENQGITFDDVNGIEQDDDSESVTWTIPVLVKKFRKLNENRLAYTKIGYLKPEKVEEIKKNNQELTFKPKIPTTSSILEQISTQKFLEKHPIEKKEQANPYNNKHGTNVDHINKLLFEVKGIAGGEHHQQQDFELIPEHEGENETASFIANQKKNQINRVDILLKKDEVKKLRIEDQKKIQDMDKLKECTFHPQTTGFRGKEPRGDAKDLVHRLYNQHKVKQKKEESAQLEQMERQIKELESCTFKPEINQNATNHYAATKPAPKGYDKTVGRLRYAVDENKKKKEALEKIPAGENYERIRNEKIKPFTFLTKEKKHKNPPFVYVDVNVGPGRSGRIGIHEDDDPKILAKNFAIAFQLNQELYVSLEELLTQQINDFHSRKQ
jgi:hypothetical protein